jgi:signal transduction histidine kinase
LLAAFFASAALTGLVSLLLSWHITRPLRQITEASQTIARGEGGRHLAPKGFAPAEIHTLAESLSTMTTQLSDRAVYIAEYAANVTHELKSPITSIKAAVELLREEGREMPAEQRDKFLGNIQAGASRMERLVGRLLELARIQSAPKTSETVEVKPFLVRLASFYDDQVKLDLSEAPATIEMNLDHLDSAVRNLLDNAVRHGAGELVDLVTRTDGGRLALTVRDRGPGISEANQKKVFDRFFTTERDAGGMGLGLAIVQAVAETRGGEVRFETGEDGTEFTLVV